MTTNPDEPAFPTLNRREWAGLSKLEIFTLAAMQGLLSNRLALESNCAVFKTPERVAESFANTAVAQARATLAALEQEAKP